ncbi:MAG: hypothetical protein IPJ84_16755 [Bdellovibrionales bacterium]|nr:hypothetical protein [Bdellovibrionales bacterium]
MHCRIPGWLKTGDTLCKTVAFLAAVLISSAILSSTAVAGERLRLQTGDVDLTDATVSHEKAPAFSVRVFAATDAEADGGLSWVGTKEKRPKERLSKRVGLRGSKHFVVQMRDRITANDLLNIRSLKIEVLRYLPDDALVVSASPNEIQVLGRSSPSIRAISLYRPEWKLSPALGASSVFQETRAFRLCSSSFQERKRSLWRRGLKSLTAVCFRLSVVASPLIVHALSCKWWPVVLMKWNGLSQNHKSRVPGFKMKLFAQD